MRGHTYESGERVRVIGDWKRKDGTTERLRFNATIEDATDARIIKVRCDDTGKLFACTAMALTRRRMR